MEHYSFLFTELSCPVCGTRFEDNQGHLRFFWGRRGVEYHVGDRIQWPDRALASNTRGAPGYPRVYVFDNDDDYSIWQCRNCGTRFDRPAILIESDQISAVSLF